MHALCHFYFLEFERYLFPFDASLYYNMLPRLLSLPALVYAGPVCSANTMHVPIRRCAAHRHKYARNAHARAARRARGQARQGGVARTDAYCAAE